jgi:hypothetical protein
MAAKTFLNTALTISLFLVVLSASATAHAKNIYVDNDGPVDFDKIRAAIDDAHDGDMVFVNDGTYVENMPPKKASFSGVEFNTSVIGFPLLYDPLDGSTSGTMTGGSFVSSGTNPWGLNMKQGWCPDTWDAEISYSASESIQKAKGTWEVWMKWHSTDYPHLDFSIIEKPAVRDEESGFGLGYEGTNGVLQLWERSQDTGGGGIGKRISFTPGQWYHFAVVWNTQQGEEKYEVYVNGLLFIQEKYVSNIQKTLCTGGEWISGDPLLRGYATLSCGVDSIYDEVAIYDYDKSGSEIRADYMRGRSPHTYTVISQANVGEIDRIEVLNRAPMVLGVETFPLDVAYYDGDTEKSPPPVGNTIYLSNNPSVGIIDHSGLVTFVGPGLGTFTISYNEGGAEIAADCILLPSGTPKAGSISTETWSLQDSPIVIWDNISIDSGTLSIEPGVHVLCNLGVLIKIQDQGILNAVATSNDWISFNANSTNPVPGTWVGIYIRENLNPSTFSFVRIENCQTGVLSYDGTYSMDHCVIADTRQYAINGQGYGGKISIDHCTFSDNQFPANYDVVMITFAESRVTNTIMVNGGLYGLSGRDMTAEYNNVWHNARGNWYSGVSQGPTDISEDPMFLNPSCGNYALQALSPCIDMGDPNYPLDPDGTRTDIGAIYFDQSHPPQPNIVVNPVSLDFGQAPIGRLSVLTLTILNGGNLDLEVIDISSDNNAFTASETSFSVEAGTNRTITVIFSPKEQIKYEGLISIQSNDDDEPLILVSLSGIGSRLPSGDITRVPIDYATIQEALNAAESWDTVLVSDGTYYENIVWPHTDNVTLRSANGSMTTVIDGGNAEESVIYVGNGQKGVLIEGFTIKNGIGSIATFHSSIRFGGGILVDEGITATIQECRIVGNGDPDNTEYSGGIFISRASNVTIDSCEIVDNLGPGVKYRNHTTYGLIRNCLIVGNAEYGIYAQGSPVRIYNNTICLNGKSGIYLLTPWPNIFNNLIANNSIGISSNDPYLSDLIAFNNIWNNTTNCADTGGNILGQNGNVSIDPLFVGGDTFDYHLKPDSPCIDTGNPNYIVEPDDTDLDGDPRVMGGRIDIGAYEYSPPIQADVKIVPRTVSLASSGRWIAAFLRLPEDCNVTDIDPNSIFLEDKIKPEQFSVDEQEQIAAARFNREEVQAILDVGDIELTITGKLTDGTIFEGTDTIKVIDKEGKK